MMMLVPEAYAGNPEMSAEVRAFYEFHGCLVEPWDGPAALCFTDGIQVGAMLDRNGLRPGKYVITSDGLVVLASELGVLELDAERVIEKGRLQPGHLFLVDPEQGRVIPSEEVKHQVATRRPYRAWLDENKIELSALPDAKSPYALSAAELARLHQVFGYTDEDLQRILAPMAIQAYEMIGPVDAHAQYDIGVISAVSGDTVRARAEADTILAARPNHLLGLVLAIRAAELRGDDAAAVALRQLHRGTARRGPPGGPGSGC
jgi:hypothetical protein